MGKSVSLGKVESSRGWQGTPVRDRWESESRRLGHWEGTKVDTRFPELEFMAEAPFPGWMASQIPNRDQGPQDDVGAGQDLMLPVSRNRTENRALGSPTCPGAGGDPGSRRVQQGHPVGGG